MIFNWLQTINQFDEFRYSSIVYKFHHHLDVDCGSSIYGLCSTSVTNVLLQTRNFLVVTHADCVSLLQTKNIAFRQSQEGIAAFGGFFFRGRNHQKPSETKLQNCSRATAKTATVGRLQLRRLCCLVLGTFPKFILAPV